MTAPDRDDLDRVLSLAESRYCLFCPQCGWDVSVDEDGCCENCGALAHGEAVETMQILRDKLIAVARAAAEYVAWIERPRTDKEIESPHAAKGRHLYNTLRSALGAITETNQPSGSDR